MTRLSVNLNKVALLRNARPLNIPGLVHAAGLVLDAGAHGITVHPRPDERHIRKSDVFELAEYLKTRPGIEFNIEGNPFHSMLELVHAVKPQQCTLVPDNPSAFTSDHGWEVDRDGLRLKPLIAELHAIGARVSLFMDPLPAVMGVVRDLGADRIELYTEPYARAFGTPEESQVLARYAAAAQAAAAVGLGLNAGHDLNRDNLPRFIAAVPGVLEVSIGHALTADALEFGLPETVRRYLAALQAGR
jgi:pyridoxine 5-phosphate synthase